MFYGLLTIYKILRQLDQPTWTNGPLYFTLIPPQDIFLCFKSYLFFHTSKFLETLADWMFYGLLTICQILRQLDQPIWRNGPNYFSLIPSKDIFLCFKPYLLFHTSKCLETLTYWTFYGLLTVCKILRESNLPLLRNLSFCKFPYKWYRAFKYLKAWYISFCAWSVFARRYAK